MACLLKLAKPLLSPKRKQQTQHFDPTLCLCFFTTVFFPPPSPQLSCFLFHQNRQQSNHAAVKPLQAPIFWAFFSLHRLWKPSQALIAFTGFSFIVCHYSFFKLGASFFCEPPKSPWSIQVPGLLQTDHPLPGFVVPPLGSQCSPGNTLCQPSLVWL